MSKELKQLKKSYLLMSKEDIFAYILLCRNKIDLKEDTKKTEEFANILFEIMELFSEQGDVTSERVILNQLVEIAWWSKEFSELVNILSRAIYKLLIDSYNIRDTRRIDLFTDFIDIIVKIPENKTIYDAISRASIELIRWGKDDEILEILSVIREKWALHPLIDAIQLLNAKVYLNALFYLDEQDCPTIKKLYREFISFSISGHKYENASNQVGDESRLILGEDIDDIFQEGVINAVLNLARINSKTEELCEDCLTVIREILQDSQQLLRKDEKEFYKDVYRLSVTLDKFNLWDTFADLPIIIDLRTERDKNQQYEIAKRKLLGIQKIMRIEEYDALKIGRRGLKLTYDINDIDDVEKLAKELHTKLKKNEPFSIVDEIDAVIDFNNDIKEHLRETGQIPADRKTIDEIQDDVTRSDDLTLSATKEDRIFEQMEFLKQLELEDNTFLINQLMYAKALLFSVGMYGYNSTKLNISQDEVFNHVNKMSEKKLIDELVNPLIRAATLRAARLDGEGTLFLLEIINKKGLKFLSKYYKQYNFINNIARLISFIARRGETILLEKLKIEIDTANRLSLIDEKVPLKIARAINEGILAYTSTNEIRKLELLEILKSLSKRYSYDEELQIKLAEGYSFLILNTNPDDWKSTIKFADELVIFSKEYCNNQQIEEKAALGLLWAQLILHHEKQRLSVKITLNPKRNFFFYSLGVVYSI
ncbi:MAG: hypothetical protein ACTSPM_09780 [Candidatus Heimdallarchaeota archaeon]